MEMEQLKYMAALLLLICMMVPKIQAHSFRFCENSDDYDVRVKALDISPYPVTVGKLFNFSIFATTGEEEITEGKMIMNIESFGVVKRRRIHDLCSETSCPISTGRDFVIYFNETLPETTPPGSCTLRANLYNQNNSRLACITFDFIIRPGPSVSDT